jgi:hypothetical protein
MRRGKSARTKRTPATCNFAPRFVVEIGTLSTKEATASSNRERSRGHLCDALEIRVIGT